MARRKKTAPKKKTTRKASTKTRLDALGAIAKDFSHWKPAGEVLVRVEAQPTIFPALDIATRVGGWPNRRVGLVHGPSNHGKTAFALGLGDSYLRAGHFFAFIDAEYTTPEAWLRTLMAERAGQPNFIAMRPTCYEDAVQGIRELVNSIAKHRNAQNIPEDTTCFIVVDSLRKLTPQGLITKMLKGDAGMDGAKGRAAMMKAALNAQWLDELVPMLYHTNASLLFIARETENPDAKPWDPKFKVGGGKAILYDSSLAARITRAGYVTKSKPKGDDSPAVVYGEKHRILIHKTKVGGKEHKNAQAFFHTSNGVLVPQGFDRARDVAQLALDLGVVEKTSAKSAWLTDPGTGEKWQGIHKMVKALHESEATLMMYEEIVRRRGAAQYETA